MIKEDKINNIKVTPVKVPSTEGEEIKGAELFDIHPVNIFIASKKRSGKTSLISTIIQKITDKDTKFYIFCGTHSLDPTWKEIIKRLDKRGNDVEVFDNIYEGKINHLDNVINQLSGGDAVPKDKMKGAGVAVPERKPGDVKIMFGAGLADLTVKEEEPKKKKKMACKYLFIFDDISAQLKNPAVAKYMKIHRHLGASSIISTQYVKDLPPGTIAQIDVFICFKNFSVERLAHIWKLLDLSIEFDDFLELYYYATKEPYSFLYVNVRSEQIRKAFNTILTLNKNS